MATLDDEDLGILARRIAAYAEVEGPRVGDFVVFPDGTERRISHIWRDGQGDGFWKGPNASVQTSDGGSYHLGEGYVSMSGGLHPGVHPSTLTDTGLTKSGGVWFFHHDWWTAHNGVDATMEFRVFRCNVAPPR